MALALAAKMIVCTVAGMVFAAESISQYPLAMNTPAIETKRVFDTDRPTFLKSNPNGTRKETARTTCSAFVSGEIPPEETTDTPSGNHPETVRVTG